MDFLSPEEWTAVALSLRVSLWPPVVALTLAIWIAVLLARLEFWSKQLLNGIVLLTLILPPVVTGHLLLLTSGPRAPVG